MRKLIVILIMGAWVWACGNNNENGDANGVMDGKTIFKKYCILCHGIDGKLGVSGAKDITVSQLTEAQRIVLISEGKNTMTPFKGVLSPEQIKAVAAYTMTLK